MTTMVRVRNNSGSLRTLPPVGDVNGVIPGPQDSIKLPPGVVVEVSINRLKMYDSPAFNACFEEHDERRADLEILPPASNVRASVADLLGAYEAEAASKPSPSDPMPSVSALDVVNGKR